MNLSSKRGRAVALVIALSVLAFLTAAMGGVAVTLFSEGAASRGRAATLQAYYLAWAGLERVQYELARDVNHFDCLNELWHNNPAAYHRVKLGSGAYQVGQDVPWGGNFRDGVMDEQSKINVNKASQAMLRALPGVSEALADEIMSRRARCAFAAVEELGELRSAERDLLNRPSREAPCGLRNLLTVYGDGQVNVNTASATVLNCLPGISAEEAERIVKFRAGADSLEGTADDGVFETPDALRSFLNMDEATFDQLRPWVTTRSTHFHVISTGWTEGRPRAEVVVQAIVERRDGLCRIVRFEQRSSAFRKKGK